MKPISRSFAFHTFAVFATIAVLPGVAHSLAVSYTVSGHVSNVSFLNTENVIYSPSVSVGDPFTGTLTYTCDPGAEPFSSSTDWAMWTQGVSLNYTIDVNHDFGFTPTGFQTCGLSHPSDPAQKDSLTFENTLPGFNGYSRYPDSAELDPMDLTITYRTNTVFSGVTLPDSLHAIDIERLYLSPYYQYYNPDTHHSEFMGIGLLADTITHASPAPAPVPEPSTLQLMALALSGTTALRSWLMRS